MGEYVPYLFPLSTMLHSAKKWVTRSCDKLSCEEREKDCFGIYRFCRFFSWGIYNLTQTERTSKKLNSVYLSRFLQYAIWGKFLETCAQLLPYYCTELGTVCNSCAQISRNWPLDSCFLFSLEINHLLCLCERPIAKKRQNVMIPNIPCLLLSWAWM